ncbi:hypothetical protein EDD99_3729 [Streptomyces sp. 846.5]|nr:hypothetical protein [Streptomyces sp. 846.5]TDU05224.1 hypothetical protein EDD99_3729 [Streptomyces sp. 846.5]
MTLIAAAIPLILLLTLGYLAVCMASPFARCRRCNGIGHHLVTDRRGKPRRGKACRHCRTTGLRIRPGRHLINLAKRVRADARRAN